MIVTFASFHKNYFVFLIGRLIFGAGSETLYIVTTIFINSYFFDQEISLAVGLGCSVSYTVDFFAGNIIARMAEFDKSPI